jgi:translocator protein
VPREEVPDEPPEKAASADSVDRMRPVHLFLGSTLVGGSLEGWYEALEKPWFLVPLWVFYLIGALYYVIGITVLYRILVHVKEGRARLTCLSLALGVLLANELWNYAFFGLRSTLAGFVGIALFLVPLTALVFTLYRYERFSARLLSPYYLWVLYDLAWTYELWRLNGVA